MTAAITKIISQKHKGRYNIYLDGHYAFPVSEDVLIRYRLAKGMEVDEQLKAELTNADSLSKLYSKALNYLAHNLKTEAEVRDKLREFTEDSTEIDATIDHLKSLNLIDDRHYAASYVRTVVGQGKNGPAWITNRLKAKRVSPEIIQNSLADFYPQIDVLRIAKKIAEQRVNRVGHDSAKMVIGKARELLIRRGFPYEIVNQVMDQMDTSQLVNQDQELIDQQAAKYWRKYVSQTGYARIQKTKQALYRKGFSLDDISASIERITQK